MVASKILNAIGSFSSIDMPRRKKVGVGRVEIASRLGLECAYVARARTLAQEFTRRGPRGLVFPGSGLLHRDQMLQQPVHEQVGYRSENGSAHAAGERLRAQQARARNRARRPQSALRVAAP